MKPARLLSTVSFVSLVSTILFAPWPALAAAGEPVAASGPSLGGGLIALGIGLMVGLAGLGTAMGQSKAVANALESIGRNPGAANKIFVPMLLGLSFMETALIFCWIMGFQLVGKM